MAVDGQAASIEVVFSWCRRLLTADRLNNRRPVVVPPELAGWVMAGPGEPTDANGCRPLGAVVERLDNLVGASQLTPLAKAVLRARYGLSEFPAREPLRPLGERLRPIRQRRPAGLAKDTVCAIGLDAIRALDAQGVADPRPCPPIEPSHVLDPATAPWFADSVVATERLQLLFRAIEAARSYVAAPGLSPGVLQVLADLDRYREAHQRDGLKEPPNAGTRRVRAIVGMMLWRLLHLPSSAVRGDTRAWK